MIAASQPRQRPPDAKLLVVDSRGRISHAQRSAFAQFLRPGDLVVANDAATLPASEVAEMGQEIHDSGKRLERLIENFLIYAQLELLGTDPQKVSALRKKQTPFPVRLCGCGGRRHPKIDSRRRSVPRTSSPQRPTPVVDRDS